MQTLFGTAKRLPVFWLSGTQFRYGSISDTEINMAPSHSITNLHDPVNPQDAATKNYIDQALANLNNAVQKQIISLIGSQLTEIPNFPDRGSFMCMITSTMDDGPTATFLASKSKSSGGLDSSSPVYTPGIIQRLNASRGVGSQSSNYIGLTMTWSQVDSSTGTQILQVAKIMDDTVNDINRYDGQYEIVFLGSDGSTERSR